MESEDQDSELAVEDVYRQEFELLKAMFEDHFSLEVIAGVLEDCAGDVNHAVDSLTKIEGSGSPAKDVLETPTNKECVVSEVTECTDNNMVPINANTCLNELSYAAKAFVPVAATAAKPVERQPRPKNHMPKVDYWTDEIKNIIRNHNEGYRVLVVMRGAPGSGKTYLAKVIVESTVGTSNSNNYANHIFSADDHMVINGIYCYNLNRLNEVHMKNQTRVHKAVNEGRSPVIVDNTNMTTWEMFPYVKDGISNGYIIEVVEPSNPWSTMPAQLAKRNIHGVPKEKIQSMLLKYEGAHTGISLVKYFKLVYPKGLEPPVRRNIPPILDQSPPTCKALEKLESVTETIVNHLNRVHKNSDSALVTQVHQDSQNDNHKIEDTPCTSNVDDSSHPDNRSQQQEIEAEKNFRETLTAEVEWDNKEEWDTPTSTQKSKIAATFSSDPKPQRSKADVRSDKFIEPSLINDDWTKNFLVMQPSASPIKKKDTSQIHLHTETIGTLVEIGDFVNDQHKNMIATPKDINENNKKFGDDKLLNQQKLDRSTSIHTSLLSGFHTCKQEDKYFINLRKMFKNVPRPVLREIYDNCAGDSNWACTIVLDGIKNNTLQTVNTDLSDSEEEVSVDCQCDERNSIIPGISAEATLPLSGENMAPQSTPTFKKKIKKEKNVTEESCQVLQNIKNSIQISENHYSQHYLNLRRPRYISQGLNDEMGSNVKGNPKDTNDGNNPQNTELDKLAIPVQSSSTPLSVSSPEVNALPSSSQNVLYQDMPSTSSANTYNAVPASGAKNIESTDAEDEYEDEFDTIESDDDKSIFGDSQSVTVNIGMEFVRKLDELYGRHDFEYPADVKPVLSIPSKILNDLNALWVESITHQLDTAHSQTDEMIKQDEEFARQVEHELQIEAEEADLSPFEEENARALPDAKAQEPGVPNFKDIMDTEIALALYEKEVKEEWKNKEPQDLAAQMTRKKLYELFPDVANETLSEMLIAHENSFDATVEVLLISTGQGHFLDQTNGVNKFVMEKEKENKERILMAEQNAALDEEEYPYLLKPGKEQTVLSMDTVNDMREKAAKHKIARDKYFQKAKWYYERKKLSEASHYSQIAALHTARYDTANSYAAAALVQYHANIHPEANVIDLHFLRVPEAEISLDLFIDDRLRKMRLAQDPRPLVLHIITGRGKHSPGRPRVKPAIMKRLKIRGLSFRQQNPGMLEARLNPGHLLTDELLNS